jgi:hypothetical protein
MGWRLLVATLALIAFAFQSYVTQTHIHPVQSSSTAVLELGGTADASTAGERLSAQKSAPANKAPAGDDPVKCPLCQAVGYSGHFVTPSAAAALLLPTTAVSVLPIAIAILSPHENPSHIWRGRGPPNS